MQHVACNIVARFCTNTLHPFGKDDAYDTVMTLWRHADRDVTLTVCACPLGVVQQQGLPRPADLPERDEQRHTAGVAPPREPRCLR